MFEFFFFFFFFFGRGESFLLYDLCLRMYVCTGISYGKSVKYRYIEFFAFDYDSLTISFQSGIAVFL